MVEHIKAPPVKVEEKAAGGLEGALGLAVKVDGVMVDGEAAAVKAGVVRATARATAGAAAMVRRL